MKTILVAIIVALVASVGTATASTSSLHWRSNAPHGILRMLKTHSQGNQGIGWTGCTRRSSVVIRCSGLTLGGVVHLYLRPISDTKASMLTVIPTLDIRKHSTTTKLRRWIVS